LFRCGAPVIAIIHIPREFNGVVTAGGSTCIGGADSSMIVQDWWFTTLLGLDAPAAPPLVGDVDADVVIVGAGMAGTCAALRLMDSGARVVVVERNIFGGSSTGRSAGFLTPDSELELSQLIRRFGKDGARDLWEVPVKGIELILETARKYDFRCDLIPQDSLYLGKGASGAKAVLAEAAARRSLGFDATVYSAQDVSRVVGSTAYSGGIRYTGTYGIDALVFVQQAKCVLQQHGVRVYESTEVLGVADHTVRTHLGSVRAQQIIFCADKLSRDVSRYANHVFHAQTFLSISEPLGDRDVAAMFPSGRLQCWDSDLVYTYFRLTGDQRLLVGGGSVLTTYALHAIRSPGVMRRVIDGFRRAFPEMADIRFRQFWPGLIDATRDLLPTIVRDPAAPWVHHVLGCVGLPWAAFCGDFVGRHALDSGAQSDHRYYDYFRAERPFLLPLWAERVLGRPIVFSLNNAWAKYEQIDRAGASPSRPRPAPERDAGSKPPQRDSR
jgi:gamma-glutamylputrescine oxidase